MLTIIVKILVHLVNNARAKLEQKLKGFLHQITIFLK
jgi:hypothetical protein